MFALGQGIIFYFGVTSDNYIPHTVSAHSLNFGNFSPLALYLFPVICTTPSEPSVNSVSLKPHP